VNLLMATEHSLFVGVQIGELGLLGVMLTPVILAVLQF
jgi:hypothetical protein